MAKKEVGRYSSDFGRKEKILNYATQTYQLSRPNKVGSVMALIRECQPGTIEEWERWYFDNAHTAGKNSFRITRESLQELGDRLYEKITEVVIPEWREAFNTLTREDCSHYIHNLTINRTYDGYLREKSVVNDGLSKLFPDVRFTESPSELDHAGDIDYLGHVTGDKAFGIQIKPVTARSNFGNYSASERMKASFEEFKKDFGGTVFILFSLDGEIANEEVIEQIKGEIERLRR